jgi:gluconokinase
VVIIVMGVSGSGKTTVGRALAHAVGGRFLDADDFHSPDNLEKMMSGVPLTDADREPWLRELSAVVERWRRATGVTVLACSALTAASRRQLGVNGDDVRVVYLRGHPDLIASRMRERTHFMPPGLLRSQLERLEPPTEALTLDVEAPVEELVERIRGAWAL